MGVCRQNALTEDSRNGKLSSSSEKKEIFFELLACHLCLVSTTAAHGSLKGNIHSLLIIVLFRQVQIWPQMLDLHAL